MKNSIDTIQNVLQDKFLVERVSEQKLQFYPSETVIVEITRWFYALQIVRNNIPVATFYEVADCIKYLLTH